MLTGRDELMRTIFKNVIPQANSRLLIILHRLFTSKVLLIIISNQVALISEMVDVVQSSFRHLLGSLE